MHGELKHEGVEAARRDLVERNLSKLPGDFARLVYLASMRNYNTGEYHHDGLACVFTESVAERAIAVCHRDTFRKVVLCPLKELVEQLELYASSNCSGSSKLVRIWERLQPYRAIVPLECSALTARFFVSNVRTALAILESRQLRTPRQPLSALRDP
jgi:hypothetical protein